MDAPDVWEDYYSDRDYDYQHDGAVEDHSIASVSGSYFSSLLNSENNDNFNNILFDYPTQAPGPVREAAKGKSSTTANHNHINYSNSNDINSYSNKNYTNYNSSSNYNEHSNKEKRRQQRGAAQQLQAADGTPSAAKREIDRLNSTIREQKSLIEKLFEDNRGLLGVVRYQGKQLADHKRAKDPHAIFTAEGQMGVLLERVRRLTEKNDAATKKLKVEEEKNHRLTKELIELKSNPNRDMFMNVFEDSITSTLDSNADLRVATQKDGRQEGAVPRAAAAAGSSPVNDDASPLVRILQRNLKSQKIVSSKEIAQLQHSLAAVRVERDGLQEEVCARERECRVHVLKIKQLRQICANLEDGNRKLAIASGAFASHEVVVPRRPQPPQQQPQSPIVARNSRLRNAKGARAKALSVETDYDSSSVGADTVQAYLQQPCSLSNDSISAISA